MTITKFDFSIDNGKGIVKGPVYMTGEFVISGYVHVIIEHVDVLNDVYSIKVNDEDLDEESLEWILEMINEGKYKVAA